MNQQRIKTGGKSNQHDDWDEVHNQMLEVQKKSQTISDPGDEQEKEADDVARKVTSGGNAQVSATPGSSVQRQRIQREPLSDWLHTVYVDISSDVDNMKIFKVDGTLVTEAKPTKMTDGTFQYIFNSPASALYIIGAYKGKNSVGTQKLFAMDTLQPYTIIFKKSELTLLREKFKNYDAVKAIMDQWEVDEPGLKGKMYLEPVKSGDTIEGFSKSTVKDNETNYGNLSKKLQQLNAEVKTGVIGNGLILLRGWKDPNIGVVPTKPDPKKLTENQKKLIATIYGEVHGAGYSGTAEQIKYIWYSMVLRVKSPAYDADLYNIVTGGAYQAYGANQYTIAKKQLDDNNPSADVIQVRDVVLAAWNVTPPSDAGIQYSHYSSKSSDSIKISSYYTGTKDPIDEVKENAAVYSFLTAKKWPTTGLSKTKAWKKRIRLVPGQLESTMYVFN